MTEFKTAKEFEKRKSSSDVFFVFVKDDSEQSNEYKVLGYNKRDIGREWWVRWGGTNGKVDR